MRPNKIDIDKKKSHCLRNCIIVSLVMVVVLCGGAFGGIYFAYSSYAEPILGIGMFDAFGVIGGLGKYEEDEIITNAFKEEDATAFYANLRNATCLNLPDSFKIVDAVNSLMSSAEGTTPEGTAPDGSGESALAGEGGTPSDPPAGGTGLGGSLNGFSTGNAYLDEVLRETSFDSSSLAEYENGGKDLSLTDKQFAAIINEVLTGIDIQQIKDIEAQLGVKLADLVNIVQVTIENDKEQSLEKMLANAETTVDTPNSDEHIVINPRDVKISLVLRINLGENVATILNKQTGGSLPEFVGGLAAALLPQKIYIGAGIYPYAADRQPTLFINNVKDKVMENALKAVDGVLKYSNPESGGVPELFATITQPITEAIKTIEGMVGKLTFVDSSLELDPIAAVMTALHVNDPDMVDPVTGEKLAYITGDNFFTMLKHIYNADNAIDGTTGADIDAKKDAFLTKVIGSANRISESDYTNNIAALAEAYGVETVVDTAHPENSFDMSKWTPSQFVENFQSIPAHINIVKPNAKGEHIYDIPQNEMLEKTLISDNAMGYMVNALIDEKVASGEMPLPVSIQIESFELYNPEGQPDELRAHFVGGVATASLLADVETTSVLYKLVSTVLPSYIFLEMDLPMSENAGKPALIINFVGRVDTGTEGATKEELEAGKTLTADAFNTLYRIASALSPDMAEQIKLENLLATVQELVNQMLDMINGTSGGGAVALAGEDTGIKIPPIKLVKGGVQMPTIYDIICTVVGGETPPTQEELRLALKDMYTVDKFAGKKPQSDDVLDAFIADELEGKLFLVNKEVNGVKEINKTNLFTSLQGLGDKFQNGSIDEIIRVRGTGLPNAPKGLLDDDPDKSTVESLKLELSDKQLAAIINTNDQLSTVAAGMPYTNFKVLSDASIKKIGADYYMTVTIKGDFDSTSMGEGPMGMKFENLLPGNIFLTATIRLTGAEDVRYSTDIYINNTNDNSNATLDKLIGALMPPAEGQPNVSFAEIGRMIGDNIAKAFETLETSGQKIVFKNGAMQAMSIYDLIYDKVIFKDPTDPDRAKVSTQDVMNVFKSMLADVENTYFTESEGALDRLVSEEFENKMLLKTGTIDSNNVFGSLNEVQTGGADKDIFTSIVPSKVLGFEKAADMKMKILESELTVIMKQEMAGYDIAGLPSIFQMPAGGSPLIAFEITGDEQIRIVFGLDVKSVDANSPDYEKYKNIQSFLPNTIQISATIDINTIMAIVDGAKPQIQTTAKMMMNKLKDEDYDKSKIIMGKLSGDSFNISTIEGQISGQVNTMFQKIIDSGLPMSFKAPSAPGKKDGYMQSGSIYDIIKKSDETKFADITDEQLHRVMRGLQDTDMTGNDANGIPNAFNPKPTDVPTEYNKIILDDLLHPTKISLSDYYIAYGIFSNQLVDENGNSIGSTEQMAILAGEGLKKAQIKYGNEALPQDATRGITLGVRVSTANYNEKNATGMAGIIPEEVFATMVFNIPKGATADSITITSFLNKMTYDDMDTLNKILGNGNKLMSKVTDTIKNSVLKCRINTGNSIIDSKLPSLGGILVSPSTEYVDKYNELQSKGVCGVLEFTFA